ncbi:unnamed protein product [Angiostrongylus costaricensis]|uniref:Phosphomannomutase n=1 Tax=Angiostrongylus costaricensis TaxID=334426 RepID=A0A0R3Q1L4_ANGCS|nr:unnamed protein product [Angiostrongylus costaricensis]
MHNDIKQFLADIRKCVSLAIVGGSDLSKIIEQLAGSENELLSQFDYVFSENGLVGFKGKERYPSKRTQLRLSKTTSAKRGLLNIKELFCSQTERDQFVVYDREHKIREKFVSALEKNFAGYGLCFVIGGQISVDVYPVGWDKTYCLQYVEKDFSSIHFFGDKTMPGGNDHAIFSDPRTIGHTVVDPVDTKLQVELLLRDLNLL